MLSRFRAHVTFGNVVALAALFVALGGGAYAAASNSFVSGAGKIQGCVNHGALDVVKAGKSCPKGTTSLPFGQSGPRGDTGSQGAAGTAAAYFAYGTGPVTFSTTVGTTYEILAKTGVPAGTYAITGKVNVSATDTHPGSSAQAMCELDVIPSDQPTVGDSGYWTANTQVLVGNSYASQTTIPLGLDLTTKSTSSIEIQCTDVTTSNATTSFALTASNAEISAVRVSALA
jgi:hypothetical protein